MATTTNTRKLVAALVSLVRAEVASPGLPEGARIQPPGPGIPSKRGESRAREGGEGAGIASPLTELDYTARTYHASIGELTSSDGIIVLEVTGLESITLQDARGDEVVINLDDPYA